MQPTHSDRLLPRQLLSLEGGEKGRENGRERKKEKERKEKLGEIKRDEEVGKEREREKGVG